MDINNLTIGQIKEIQSFCQSPKSKNLDQYMLGKTCMIRTYSAGVHFGLVVEKENQTVLLKNAKRVHYWTEACSLSQLAKEGSKNFGGCRISVAVDEIILEQVIEIIPMPDETVKAFYGAKEWKK